MSSQPAPAFLDTAIPMYARGSPHIYRDACRWIMTEVALGRLQVVIDAEVVQEVLHRYGALRRYADAVSMAQDLMTLVPHILPVTESDVRKAVSLFQQFAPRGVRSRDLVHAAVMQNHGLTQIISTDAHFDLVPGLTRLDPIGLHQAATRPSP
jgi:predicted nucleic acid-binding protein